MIPRTKPLLALTAADLMSAASVLVPEGISLLEAARMLSKAQVSGAPVVDADGRCVGVISTTDFLRWAEQGRDAERQAAPGSFCAAGHTIATENLPEEAVSQHMTRDPVTISPDVPIGELALMMLDAHIHRLIVVAKEHRLVGVVSTTDILAAVAQAAALAGRVPTEVCT